MKESKTITFGDVLDLLDVNRESGERVTLYVGLEALTGLASSPLWEPFEQLPVDNIGLAGAPTRLEVWTHDPQ